MKKVDLFTDGACSGNPGPGGWGAILRWNGNEKEISGGNADTTNNRMELTAVIEGLRALKARCAVTIHTDSKYVIDGVTLYLQRWKSSGWKTADKKKVLNQDLWETLDGLLTGHDVSWAWIKGHSGHPDNERADLLARKSIP